MRKKDTFFISMGFYHDFHKSWILVSDSWLFKLPDRGFCRYFCIYTCYRWKEFTWIDTYHILVLFCAPFRTSSGSETFLRKCESKKKVLKKSDYQRLSPDYIDIKSILSVIFGLYGGLCRFKSLFGSIFQISYILG